VAVVDRSRRTGGIGTLKAEMGQGRPFTSLNQEATVALLRTASLVTRAFARLVEPAGLSWAQYNALRIVRGAGRGGVPTLAIRERMIDEGTTITRLLDKLETAGLIRRERSEPDRRQVICYATADGRRLLDQLDPKVDALDETVVGFLSRARLEAFVRVLDEIRAVNAERGAARTAARAGG
jgi:MarR family transcriptional regulator, organic hydroperoxide resistance regulator